MIYASNNTSTTFGSSQPRRQAFADISNSRQFAPSQTSKSNHQLLPTKNGNNNIMTSMALQPDTNNINHYAPSSTLQASSISLKNPMSYQHTGIADDIDKRDRDDPFSVTDYAEDMYAHFREREHSTSPKPTYMAMQPDINEKMRSILIDWLVSVQVQFKLCPETLYLSINIIDRYLEKAEVPRTMLQLVGATSLLIAAKYEEVYNCPRVNDIVLICDNLYPQQEIVQIETKILCALGFKISVPTAHTFLVRYLKAAHADEKIALTACYILEGTLQSYNLLKYRPSQLAAASTLIARNAQNRNPWSPTLLKYTQYYEEDVIPIANDILEAKHCKAPEITAVDRKYSAKRYGRVARNEFSYLGFW